MILPLLDNLMRMGHLQAAPRNNVKVQHMLAMARTHVADGPPELEGFANLGNQATRRASLV